MRSAAGGTATQNSSDLTRKAEVVEAATATIIPEHVKPVLRKRAGAALANVSAGVFKPLLSPDLLSPNLLSPDKQELQRQLTQDVLHPAAERAIDRPETKLRAIPAAPTSPDSAKTPGVSRSRRFLPWMLAGLVAVTLPVVGILSNGQSPSDPPTDSGQVESPSSPPADSSDANLPHEQSDQALLDHAKALADQQKWQDAIATLQHIPADSLLADQVKTYLDEWSTQLLTAARSLYDHGDLDAALTAAHGIPAHSADHEQAQSAIAAWTTEKQTGEQLRDVLNNQWDVQSSRQLLSQIQSAGFHEILKAEIEAIEVEILTTAQSLYAEGKKDEAIHKAQLIPEDSPSHAEAQSLIAAWTTELPPENPHSGQPVYDYSWLTQSNWLVERSATEADVQGKTALQLDILRNSLFARHGLKFTDPELQRAYQSQDWYQPTDISPQEVYDQLSEQEWQNFRAICTYQKQNNLSLDKNLDCG